MWYKEIEGKGDSSMNPKYYVSPDELQKVIAFLNKHSVGGGVKDVVPNLFVGPFSVPVVEGKDMLGVMLNCGVEMNAGLTLDLMNKGYTEQWTVMMLQAIASHR
jgi:hypothetical protein